MVSDRAGRDWDDGCTSKKQQKQLLPALSRAERIVLVFAGVLVLVCHVLLAFWWEELAGGSKAHAKQWPTPSNPRGGQSAAVTGINEGSCSALLPLVPSAGCTEAAVERTLEAVFSEVESSSDAATCGEVTVEGLQSILGRVFNASGKRHSAFEVVLDLGANGGSMAVATALLGYTRKALAVESRQHRFSDTCRAWAKNSSWPTATCEASDTYVTLRTAVVRPEVRLLQGEAQDWPELAGSLGFPPCSSDWLVIVSALCFRGAELTAVLEQVRSSCPAGAMLASVGHEAYRDLPSIGSLRVRTSSSLLDAEVLIYRLDGKQKVAR